MVDKKSIILLCLVALIAIAPLVIFYEGYFGCVDCAAAEAIKEIGYKPWFNPIWEPPSNEIKSLLFALQTAIGAIIIGYVFRYYNVQEKR
ncbi:MAG: energy-coupling factor ABC transporter substrate-binding protein [Methanobacteriaceae archaeon]|jgi:cobalt/nickel transport protein